MKSLINFPMQRTIFSSVPRVFRIRIEMSSEFGSKSREIQRVRVPSPRSLRTAVSQNGSVAPVRRSRSDTLSDTRTECAPSPGVPGATQLLLVYGLYTEDVKKLDKEIYNLCALSERKSKIQKIHVFLPCEQSADEPHGSMIHAVRRIVAQAKRK
jgi:hypothetical protein